MVLGLKKKVIINQKLTEEEKEKKKMFIRNKITKLMNAIKIPGAINQFKTIITGTDEKLILDLCSKYSPETKAEKKERLSKTNPREGEKPILLKFGIKHIVSLLEQRKLKFIVIAADVLPITTICFLPTLCKKVGCSYAIIDKQSKLGALVHLKKTTVIGLENVRNEDIQLFEDVLRISNAMFLDKYEYHISNTGGCSRKVNKLND